MKKLDISTVINGFDGEPIIQADRPVTVKIMLCHYLGTHSSANGEESILTHKLGQKVYDHNTDGPMDLEDAEYNLIKKVIQPPKHIDLLYAPFFELIKAAEKGE
jgi:hypothetical protein